MFRSITPIYRNRPILSGVSNQRNERKERKVRKQRKERKNRKLQPIGTELPPFVLNSSF